MQSPRWLTARVSHLDLTLAWAACRDAQIRGKGAITRTAEMWDVAPSIVQKALDRVEAALGGQFFVTRVKRSGRLTERGERFADTSTHFVEVWAAMLEVEDVDSGPPSMSRSAGRTAKT